MAEDMGLNVRLAMESTSFTQQITAINREMKVVQAEFAAASTALGNFGSEQQRLEAKSQALTQQIQMSQQKVDLLTTAHERAKSVLAANVAINEELRQSVEQATQAYNASVTATGATSAESQQLRTALDALNGQYTASNTLILRNAATTDNLNIRLQNTQAAQNRLQNELTATNADLETQSSRWTALGNSMQSASDRLASVGEGMNKAGQALSVGVTAPILAAGGAMLKGAIDAENAQSKLQASLGITAEEAKELGSVATDVWDDAFGENIEEVDAAIITVRKNMGELAEDELKSVTEGAFTLADVFGAEVADSTKAAGTMMKNFGISGQDALDIITVGFQKGGDYSGELLDTLNEYAPQFASMGLTADQAMGVLIAGANAGSFSLDKVGDAMKEFNIRASDGSKSTAEGFATIGLNAEQMGAAMAKGGEEGQKAFMATVTGLAAMKDPMAQNAAGTALFGTQWEDVRAKVIVAMADGVKGIGDFKGATNEASKAMYDNNPGATLTAAMRELQAAIGPALLPLAGIITNDIVPALKSFADGFNNLSPSGQKAALAVAGIAAAIGPVLVVGGTLVSAVGSIAGAFAAASGAMAAAGGASAVLGIAFTALTGPIGIAVALIAGITAVGVSLVNHFKQDAIPAVQLYGSETSEATKKAVQGYLDLDDKATKSLLSLKLNGSVISKESADALVKNFSDMGAQIKAGMDKDYADDLAVMQKFFADSKITTAQEQKDILDKMNADNQNKKTVVDLGEKEIKAILTLASTEKRALTTEEQIKINEIQATMKTNAVKALSETETESKLILEKMKTQAGEITAQQAAEVVKNSIEQRDKAVKSAEEQYDQTVKAIIKQRDETGVITTEQADKLIKEAGRQKAESVTKATEMNNEVVAQAKIQAGDHVGQVEWTTGEIKSKWQVMKDDTAQKMADIGKDTSEKWEQIKKDTSIKMEEIKSDLSTKWESIKKDTSDKVEEIKTTVSTKFTEMRQSVTDKMEEVKTSVKTKWNEAQQYLEDVDLMQIGRDIINGLINGIGDKAQALWNKAKDMANSISESVKSALDQHSPSRVMQTIGQFTVDGLILGIGDKVPAVATAMDSVASAIAAKGASFISAAVSIGQQFSAALQANVKAPTIPSSGGSSGGSHNGMSDSDRAEHDSRVDHVDVDSKGNYTEVDKKGNVIGGGLAGTEHYHDGGWVGDAFKNLQLDEIPAILQTGEFVLSRKMIDGLTNPANRVGSNSTISNSNTDNSRSIVQNVVINSPKSLTPSEVARQSRNAMRELALNF